VCVCVWCARRCAALWACVCFAAACLSPERVALTKAAALSKQTSFNVSIKMCFCCCVGATGAPPPPSWRACVPAHLSAPHRHCGGRSATRSTAEVTGGNRKSRSEEETGVPCSLWHANQTKCNTSHTTSGWHDEAIPARRRLTPGGGAFKATRPIRTAFSQTLNFNISFQTCFFSHWGGFLTPNCRAIIFLIIFPFSLTHFLF